MNPKPFTIKSGHKMELHDELQVQAFEDYLREHRVCLCGLGLEDHMQAEEGQTRPCLKYGSTCLNFSDAISREAAAKLVQPKGKAPMGYCH